jgi:glutathione S-transferase
MLFHITTRADWERASRDGVLAPVSLREVGFVHLSTAEQWPRTAARFFAGHRGLVLLTIDPVRLDAEVRFEQADGEAFPHLYGALGTDAVVRADHLEIDARGVPCVVSR